MRVRIEQNEEHSFAERKATMVALRERALFNPTATKRATLFSATTLQLGEPGSLGPEAASRRHPSFRQAADALQN